MQKTFFIANRMIIFARDTIIPSALFTILRANATLSVDDLDRIIAHTDNTATLGHLLIMLHLYGFTVATHEQAMQEYSTPEALQQRKLLNP